MNAELALLLPDELVNVETGERLPATIDNAVIVLEAAREMKRKLGAVIAETTAFLVSQSEVRGSKTFHSTEGTLTLSGGPSSEYDPADLMEGLREAGCPEDRIEEAVVAEVTYKVNRSVLRQLAGANLKYADAIDAAERVIERPYRASVKA